MSFGLGYESLIRQLGFNSLTVSRLVSQRSRLHTVCKILVLVQGGGRQPVLRKGRGLDGLPIAPFLLLACSDLLLLTSFIINTRHLMGFGGGRQEVLLTDRW